MQSIREFQLSLAANKIIMITWYRPGSPRWDKNLSTVGTPDWDVNCLLMGTSVGLISPPTMSPSDEVGEVLLSTWKQTRKKNQSAVLPFMEKFRRNYGFTWEEDREYFLWERRRPLRRSILFGHRVLTASDC